MKNRMQIISIALLSVCLSSCLEAGLEELPLFDEADITDFRFEYRYDDPEKVWPDGSKVIDYTRLTTENQLVDKDAGSIVVTLRVPEAGGTFSEVERAKVTLTNIVGYCYLSTAATIEPIEGAPKLGSPGNFSSPVKYRVTAADGKIVKIWMITVVLLK
jgi:hypothetical protein